MTDDDKIKYKELYAKEFLDELANVSPENLKTIKKDLSKGLKIKGHEKSDDAIEVTLEVSGKMICRMFLKVVDGK